MRTWEFASVFAVRLPTSCYKHKYTTAVNVSIVPCVLSAKVGLSSFLWRCGRNKRPLHTMADSLNQNAGVKYKCGIFEIGKNSARTPKVVFLIAKGIVGRTDPWTTAQSKTFQHISVTRWLDPHKTPSKVGLANLLGNQSFMDSPEHVVTT